MHPDILTPAQSALMPLVKSFSQDFGLVGGTAIALHLGHRRSIDFDLFSSKEFDNAKVDRVFRDENGQFTLSIHDIRFTFFHYPYPIEYAEYFDGTCRLPDLVTLAAMKAFALGRRAKWKDYVDLYFILKLHHGIQCVADKAKQVFGNEFNARIFREQLGYFHDIDYSEEVIFMKGHEVDDAVIKKGLTEFSLAP